MPSSMISAGYISMIMAACIPFLFFFWLAMSADFVDGKFQLRYRARGPEIAKSLICWMPVINILSPKYELGDNQLLLYLAIGLLTAPFACPLFFAPSANDIEKRVVFFGKWCLSKLEAAVYGVVLLALATWTLSLLRIPSDIPATVLSAILGTAVHSPDRVPTSNVAAVLVAGAVCRGSIVIRALHDSPVFPVVVFFTIGSTLLALVLWLLAISQIEFDLTSWRAPVGGVVTGALWAATSDLAFKRAVARARARHGQW